MNCFEEGAVAAYADYQIRIIRISAGDGMTSVNELFYQYGLSFK